MRLSHNRTMRPYSLIAPMAAFSHRLQIFAVVSSGSTIMSNGWSQLPRGGCRTSHAGVRCGPPYIDLETIYVVADLLPKEANINVEAGEAFVELWRKISDGLGDNLDQQLVFEVATVQPIEDDGIGVQDAQYGFGVRYQIPINRAWLFRADATYQIFENADEDNFGIRTEIRRKF